MLSVTRIEMTTGQRHEAANTSRADDARLIARIRLRDMAAFEELYRLYHGRLTRFLFRLIHRPTLIEEVVNDTFVVVWDRADTFNGASKLSTWIFAIAYRKAMKALRQQDEPVEDRQAELRADPDHSPEDALGHSWRQILLAQAIDELSPDHRAVVEFTYFQEMGYREIAVIMDCPVDTVKTRMFHARRHLKRRLAGQLPDWL